MRVVLREWERVECQASALARACGMSGEELAAALSDLVVVTPGFGDVAVLQARRRVGELQCGGCSVHVIPKVGVEPLLKLMCSVVGLRPQLSGDVMGAGPSVALTLKEALAAGYVLALEELLASGQIHRSYQTKRAQLPVPRGSLDFARMVQRPATQGVACRVVGNDPRHAAKPDLGRCRRQLR